MEGWIKLYRKLADWEWYDNPVVFKVFIDLLLNANHQDNCWHGQVIKRGSLVTSVASIASRNGLSTQQVRTALKHLEKTGEINKQSTNKNTLIIVLNYTVYQDFTSVSDTQSNNQLTNNQQSNNNQITTNKNVIMKECNNDISTNLLTCDKSSFDWSQYDEEEMTEYYPGTVLTIAEFKYWICLFSLSTYLFKKSRTTKMIKFTVPLITISKKKHQRILVNKATGKPFISPSQEYKQYEKSALWFIPRAECVDYPVNVKCLFYMPTHRKCDLTNMLECIDDVMVKAGLLDDDNFNIIASHDGSRVLYDKSNPRTEVYIERQKSDDI